MKRILSFIIACVMCFSIMQASALDLDNLYDSPYVFKGDNSLKIICNKDDSFKFFTSKPITLKANTNYVVEAWTIGGGAPSIRILNSTSWAALAEIKGGAGGIWQKITGEFYSGANTSVYFAFTNNPYDASGTRYFDEVAIYENDDLTKTNLVVDPGFEEGTGWNFKDNDTVFQKETYVDRVTIPVSWNVIFKDGMLAGFITAEVKLDSEYSGKVGVVVNDWPLYYSIQRDLYVGIVPSYSPAFLDNSSIVDTPPKHFVYGNVDGDYDFEDISQAVDSSDLQMLKRLVKDDKASIGPDLVAADLDGDGLTDSSDLQSLKQFLKTKKQFSILK